MQRRAISPSDRDIIASISFPDPREREKLRKQREIMSRVLADNIVRELIGLGCSEGEVIEFASEVLRSVNDFAQKRGRKSSEQNEPAESTTDIPIEVIWNIRPVDNQTSIVEGAQVTLHPLEMQHKPLLERWRLEPRIQDAFVYPVLDEILSKPGINRRTRIDFIIQDPKGSPVGLVSLVNICRKVQQAEMAKLVGEQEALGKGYAREATCLLLTYAFREAGLERVYLRTNGFNVHNVALNEAVGFRFEGILRESQLVNGHRADVVQMSMLMREFERRYIIRQRTVR
jgi:RimJ/RimL family protein N-acetyltransferase